MLNRIFRRNKHIPYYFIVKKLSFRKLVYSEVRKHDQLCTYTVSIFGTAFTSSDYGRSKNELFYSPGARLHESRLRIPIRGVPTDTNTRGAYGYQYAGCLRIPIRGVPTDTNTRGASQTYSKFTPWAFYFLEKTLNICSLNLLNNLKPLSGF